MDYLSPTAFEHLSFLHTHQISSPVLLLSLPSWVCSILVFRLSKRCIPTLKGLSPCVLQPIGIQYGDLLHFFCQRQSGTVREGPEVMQVRSYIYLRIFRLSLILLPVHIPYFCTRVQYLLPILLGDTKSFSPVQFSSIWMLST